ncbi:hypothetical protein EON83_21395 [bacterium]|nr:MAG: hypothetical protein EON83_21395 [bacterium]
MKPPSTLAVLATLAIIAAAWEIWTILNHIPGDTFSATLRELGENQPFIPFMCGMLGRHLYGDNPETNAALLAGYDGGVFWPLKDKKETL